jgi:hypothetical protein
LLPKEVIVGFGGGRGTLILHGRTYPLVIGGMSFGATIGLSTAHLRGHAYHIRTPQDIEGTYSAIGAGGAVVAGGGRRTTPKTQRAWFSSSLGRE